MNPQAKGAAVADMRDPSGVIRVLLVEDSRADARLMLEIFRRSDRIHQLKVAGDGVEALAILHKQGCYSDEVRPDLVLLDLNLPKKNGFVVLAEMKKDPDLRVIPVVIVTSSAAERDVLECYSLHANCYVSKPIDLNNFIRVVRAIEEFWMGIATLPSR